MSKVSKLPKWILDVLPEPASYSKIDYVDEKYVLTDVDGNVSEFSDLVTAYDASGSNVKISKNVPEKNDSGFISVDTNDGFHRMILSYTDKDRIKLIESYWRNWLTTAKKYYRNPDSFINAYSFVTSHPCFWIKDRPDNDFSFNTDYASRVWVRPTWDDNGVITWMLEAGGHTPELDSNFHDLRLDVYAPTVEDGFIQLAALVAKFFDDDGNEIANVDYEPSELELLLEERMDEVEAAIKKRAEKESQSEGAENALEGE